MGRDKAVLSRLCAVRPVLGLRGAGSAIGKKPGETPAFWRVGARNRPLGQGKAASEISGVSHVAGAVTPAYSA